MTQLFHPPPPAPAQILRHRDSTIQKHLAAPWTLHRQRSRVQLLMAAAQATCHDSGVRLPSPPGVAVEFRFLRVSLLDDQPQTRARLAKGHEVSA